MGDTQILITIFSSLGSAIVGGIIGGLFSVFITRLNHKHDDESKRKDLLREADKEKPRLEIIDFKGFDIIKDSRQEEVDASILVLGIKGFNDNDGRAFFDYDKKALKNKNLVFVEYLFKNTGLTEIEELCITSNSQRFVSIFDINQRDTYLKEGLLNYDVWLGKKYIKTNQTIRIRVYYIKDQIPASSLWGPSLTIWLWGVNGLIWSQVLRAPGNEIEISRLNKYSVFKETTNITKQLRY